MAASDARSAGGSGWCDSVALAARLVPPWWCDAGIRGASPVMLGSPPLPLCRLCRAPGQPCCRDRGGRLPLHFNCPAAELLIKAQQRTKPSGVSLCPVPPALPGRGEVVQPGSSHRRCRGDGGKALASHAAALAGPGPVRSGQTKREENEAGSRAQCVCSAPRQWCQRRLPKLGANCVPLQRLGHRMGSAAYRACESVLTPRRPHQPGSTVVAERGGLLRLTGSILGAVPVASQVTNTRGGWQTSQWGLSAARSCCSAACLIWQLAGSGQACPGTGRGGHLHW